MAQSIHGYLAVGKYFWPGTIYIAINLKNLKRLLVNKQEFEIVSQIRNKLV